MTLPPGHEEAAREASMSLAADFPQVGREAWADMAAALSAMGTSNKVMNGLLAPPVRYSK